METPSGSLLQLGRCFDNSIIPQRNPTLKVIKSTGKCVLGFDFHKILSTECEKQRRYLISSSRRAGAVTAGAVKYPSVSRLS